MEAFPGRQQQQRAARVDAVKRHPARKAKKVVDHGHWATSMTEGADPAGAEAGHSHRQSKIDGGAGGAEGTKTSR